MPFFRTILSFPASSSEEEVEYVSEKELQKTATGQLSTSLGGETVFSLNHKEAEALITQLEASRGDLASHLSNVLISAKKLSGYQEPVTV